MRITKCSVARLAGAAGLAFLLSAPAFAAPQNYPPTEYRADRISTQGRISSISREGDMYRIQLDHGSYDYFIPAATVGNRNLMIGSFVRLGGFVSGDTVNVDFVAGRGEPYYNSDPRYMAMPYPARSGGWMTGVVTRVNRHLGYIDLMEDGSGAAVRIDVRHMDMRKPFNIWSIHTGDRISVNGLWESRGNFDARRIEY